jgi:hypothetical protein
MLSYNLNCLAQCLEMIKGSPSGTQSITHKFQGENMLLMTYTTIVHIASDASLQAQTRRESEASISKINDALKTVKGCYKEICGQNLKVKELSTDDSIEVISTTFHSPRKVAYYRRHVTYQIG